MDTTPAVINVVLHESCWADGHPTAWSAQRTLQAGYDTDPTLWVGEHVFPWMLDPVEGYPDLVSWQDIADELAAYPWPRLYDEQRLLSCPVPCAAIVYADDAYVPAELSYRTAALLPTMRVWDDHAYRHDGLDTDGAVLDRLITLARA